jgi:hypothetical protein
MIWWPPAFSGEVIMLPWFWFWAPQLHLPWSGNVTQDIEPNTSWFFRGIEPTAGNASIEQKAFGVASYGRQLGLITEVLIEVARSNKGLSKSAARSLQRLEAIRQEIEQIKDSEQEHSLQRLEAEVAALQRSGGEPFRRLSARLLPLLAAPPK